MFNLHLVVFANGDARDCGEAKATDVMDVMEMLFAVYGIRVQAYLHAECGPGLRRVLDIPVCGGSSTRLFFGLSPRLSPDRTVQRTAVSAALRLVALFWHRRSS